MMRSVPRTYDPGKRHPREGLAYLSKAEMEFLRKVTDGRISSGPRGIPSFRWDDDYKGPTNTGSTTSTSHATNSGSDSSRSANTGNNPGNANAAGYNGASAAAASGSASTSYSSGGYSNTGNNPGNSNASGYNGGPSASPSGGLSGGSYSSGPGAGFSSPGGGTGMDSGGGYSGGPSYNSLGGGFNGPGAGLSSPGTSQTRSGNSAYSGGPASVGAGFSAPSPANSIGAGMSGPGMPVASMPQTPVTRNFGSGIVPMPRATGDAALMGRMMMAESGSIVNQDGSVNLDALQATGDVMRNRMAASGKSLKSILSEKNQFTPWHDGGLKATPESTLATSIAEGILSGQTPSNIGTGMNYANKHTINTTPGMSSSKTKAGFNSMEPVKTYVSALNPNIQHSFGTWGVPANEVMWGPGTTSQMAGLAGLPAQQQLASLIGSETPSAAPGDDVLSPYGQSTNLPQQGAPPSAPQSSGQYLAGQYGNDPQLSPQMAPGMLPAAPSPQMLAGLPPGNTQGVNPGTMPSQVPTAAPSSVEMASLLPQPPASEYFPHSMGDPTLTPQPGEMQTAYDDTAPGFWGGLYNNGAEAADYVKANVVDPVQQKIADNGGFAEAGRKARMVNALMGTGNPTYAQGHGGGNGYMQGAPPQPGYQAPAQAQMSPAIIQQTVQRLEAELQTTTDPARRQQILMQLAKLDPNIVRYGVQMETA